MKRLSILLLLSLMLVAGLPVKGLEGDVETEEVTHEFDSRVRAEQERQRIIKVEMPIIEVEMPTTDDRRHYQVFEGTRMRPVAIEGFQPIVRRWAEEVQDAAVEMPI